MPPWYPPGAPRPTDGHRPDVKYEPRECRLRHLRVWAVLTKAAESDWAIVNCLDKEPACESSHCALIARDGVWPFEELRNMT